MKKSILIGLATLIPTVTLSPVVDAKTVLGTKQRCFQVGEPIAGGWNETLKIKP